MVYSFVSKAILFLCIWTNGHAVDLMGESSGNNNTIDDTAPTTTCFNLLVSPQHRYVFDYSNTFQFSKSEQVGDDIRHYLLDSFGNQILSSTSNSSSVCYDDDSCHYLFLRGHGNFTITNDLGDIISEGDLMFGSPKLIRMASNSCTYYCHEEEYQLVIVGEKDDKPTVNDVALDQIAGVNNQQHTNLTFNSGNNDDQIIDESSELVWIESEHSLIMRTMCLKPTDCYHLVGSSVYMLIGNDSRIEAEGSTYDGHKTLGRPDNCPPRRCPEKPLLVETKRGQEITLVLSSISGMSVFGDVNSPQYLAACWLIHDDERRLRSSEANVIQRYVLALLFYTLGGSDWTSNFDFLTSKHECEWNKPNYDNLYGVFFSGGSGVRCDDSGDVSAIILVDNILSGTIPLELSWLLHIEYLDLSQNLVSETIPSQIGNLKSLRQLRLFGNQLTGSIPRTLGEIESLAVMDLSNNALEGSMISNEGGNLIFLDVMNNRITGTIPDNIGSHSSLIFLNFYSNLLTGTLPPNIINMKELEFLILDSNSLTGTLPPDLFTLPGLMDIWFSGNLISGTIPSNVTNDNSLVLLYLDGNQLTGTVPSEMALFEDLGWVMLQDNYLTGEIPSDLARLENLADFRFQSNDITGVVPNFEGCYVGQLEADCDSPQKVECECCTTCHGIFTERTEGVSCPSRELQIIFDGLQPGDWIEFDFLTSDEQSLDWFQEATQETSYTYHRCVSTSSCYKIFFLSDFVSYPFDMTVLINEEVIMEEFVAEPYLMYDFGYSLDRRSFQEGTCDSFELCGAVVQANSTKRELIDRLTRVTGVNVFDDITSPFYNAACEWVNYLDGKSNDQLELSATLQYFYLALFYFSTNGEEWVNSDSWLTSDSYCNWYGISCNEHDIVTALNLTSNNLVGSIMTEFGELRGLEHAMLGNNSLYGTVPVEIGLLLRNLKHLNISRNALLGTLPSEMGLLTDLAQIDMSHNRLGDWIPSEMGRLENIEVFDFFGNTLAGALPAEFFRLTGLRLLSLGSNLLTGDVSSVKRFFNLESLDLSDNFFTGTLPLGAFQRNLRVFQLSGNQFIGSMSSSIAQLSALEELYLYNNQLTGNLPSQLGNLDKLTKVSLSYNMIKGLIPSHLGQLKNLTLLHLHNTDLQGYGDYFVHPIGEYITDCGNTITSPAKVLCNNCSSCCNVDGDCLRKDVTWPGESLPSRIAGSWFIFLVALGSTIVLVVLMAVRQCFFERTGILGFCEEFQEESAYKFFLSDNLQAILLATVTVLLQGLLLYIFIAASDFTALRNDWEYSMSCPNNSIDCDDRRSVTALAWFAFSFVLFSFLMKDLLQSVKMINESITLRFWKGILAGFIVFFTTSLSIAASTLYNYSTGISDTDILKDAVILLFLNDIDEQLYTLVRLAFPSWVEKRNRVVKQNLDTLIRTRSTKTLKDPHDKSMESSSANIDESLVIIKNAAQSIQYKGGDTNVKSMETSSTNADEESLVTVKNTGKSAKYMNDNIVKSTPTNFDEKRQDSVLQIGNWVGQVVLGPNCYTIEEEPNNDEEHGNEKNMVAQDYVEEQDVCDLKDDIGVYKAEIRGLNKKFAKLEDNYVQLENDHARLTNEHGKLKHDHTKLQGEHSNFMDDYTRLKNDYLKLKSDYSRVKYDFTNVKDEISEMKKVLHFNGSK